MDKINVAIVEDDPDWIKAMIQFLKKEGDMQVICTASNKEEAISMAKAEQVDVILMDVNLSENRNDGIYAANEISGMSKVKIIMLTSLTDDDVITKSFTAGAVNYISKMNYKEIPAAIRSTYHDSPAIEVLLKQFTRMKKEEQLSDLTRAEREIYNLAEQGYSRSQMEKLLVKSESTIKNQMRKVLKKLGAASFKRAIEKVHKKGLHLNMEDNQSRDYKS